ncbi:MAG: TetR/AcrR family transcriptional regulator [Actinomycetota bacterium]|nr:TetR/AcrR family transcriptional regulator [Actinomycetota bacterium]
MKRGYESEQRRAQSEATRQRILVTAQALVVERGYRGTTIAELARRADVHVDTIYELVGRKPLILRELVERAISGTDRPLDPFERDYVQEITAEPDAGRKLDLYAAAMRRILSQLAPLFLALRDASATDPEAAQVWSQISDRRATNMRLLAADLLATGQLRGGLSMDEVADTIWATNSPDLHRLLVQDRGWSPEHYQEWLADSWRRLFLSEK